MNKFIKKLGAVALTAVMICSLFAGCSSSDQDKEKNDKYKIGICQLMQHNALDKATQGFKDALTELLGEDKVEFLYQNASGDSAACATIANQFVSNQYDLIMANATPALQACATATAASKTPVVATSVTDFGVALGIEMASTDATGINVTGTSDLVSLESQAQQILDLFPDTKKVGCIYCSAEANSQYQVDGVKKTLEANGVECNFYSFADSNDIQTVVNKAAAESDAIYIPTDNTAASNGSIISAACKEANVPIIAGEEGIFKNTNAVATLSLSFYDIGSEAGEMAFDILVNGTDPATMNIRLTDKLTYLYNEDVVKGFGITVPENYTAYDFTKAE